VTATFFLVSGAWHGGWCWERVVPLLQEKGHRVIAPDLAGMGADRARVADAGLALWTEQVAALIDQQPQPVILVGHSRGGAVISEVAERMPEKIAMLVYLNAFLLKSGDTILTALTRLPCEEGPSGILPAADGTCSLVPAEAGAIFYNRAKPDWVDRALSLIGPEPLTSFDTPVSVTNARFGTVPRAYIECLHDRALPIALQRLMLADLPCDPVITLESDHSPFYSAPETLADALSSLSLNARS
jgi:pimeloyl-ACP methyl ester carboxylesterase